MIYFFIVVIVVLIIILLIIHLISQKYNLVLLKINKGKEDIEYYLSEKLNMLNKCRELISNELKDDDVLKRLDDINKDDSFSLNDSLKTVYNDLLKVLDENDKLIKSEDISNIVTNLRENESNILGLVKYYNDNSKYYNKLIHKFPTSIIAFIKNYKDNKYYNDEKIELFEILNDNTKED